MTTPSEPIAGDRLVEATAKSIAVYYEAEKAFMAEPTAEAVHAYLAAVDRLTRLRLLLRENYLLADAILGIEKDESVGR